MYTAGYQVIASSLGCAAAEDRRFNINKLMRFEVVSHRLDNAVSQEQRILHSLAAQVDESVLQSQVFAR